MLNPEQRNRVEWLFERALSLQPLERLNFLQTACLDDLEVKQEVESLLAADQEAGAFLEQTILPDALRLLVEQKPAAVPETFAACPPPDRLQQIGPYEILRKLGEGGMSMVYLAARRDQPADFRVAIKLIRPGIVTDQALQRFRQECQILARMRHPHIAQLMDSGTNEDGRPYFVMEYVEGIAIDEYCEASSLPVERRLQLFQDVCSAVQFAHRNLVIHRDLKPSNILVTPEGVVKLLDFGIAKLLLPGPQLANQTTVLRSFLTPQYASPEQILGQTITTASDVYSLGILLFKLLTGQRPYSLDNLSAQEVEHLICELDPLAPSAMLSGIHAKVRRSLAGDLDTIVLMAMRKEPERRYASVQDFSEDIGRHLEGLPILARKNTFRYRSGKFVRRHAVVVGASALVCLSLISGAVVSIWQARNALEQRRVSELQRVKAEKVSAFLADLLKSADPSEARGKQVTVREVLDRAAVRIKSEFANQPLVRAALLDAIGVAYTGLGLFQSAEPLLQESVNERSRLLGPMDPELADSLAHLAALRYAQFRPREAAELSRRSLSIRLKVFGPDHPKVAESLQALADALQITDDPEVETLLRRVLVIRQKTEGNEGPAVAQTLQALGWWLITRDRYAEAEPIYYQVLRIQRQLLGTDHEATILAVSNFAILRLRQGRYAEAEQLFRESLSGWIRIKGADHPEVAAFESALGVAICARGRLKEAEALQRHALSLREAYWGSDHPAVDNSLNHLGVTLYREGQFREAEALFRRALQMRMDRWGKDHRSVADTLVNLGRMRLALGDVEEAKSFFQDGLATWQALLGEEHPGTAEAMDGLASTLAAEGNRDSAIRLFQKALTIQENVLGPVHPDVAESLTRLGQIWISVDARHAEPLLRRSFDIRHAAFGDHHWATAESASLLGECLWTLGRTQEALPLLREGYTQLRGNLGDHHPLTIAARSRLVEAHQL